MPFSQRPHKIRIRPAHKHVAVLFGDIAGFSQWSRAPLYYASKQSHKLLKIYRHFFRFFESPPYFAKLNGDGLMVLLEMEPNNKKANAKRLRRFVQEAGLLADEVNSEIRRMSFPRPAGFRVRMAAGDSLRFDWAGGKNKNRDYVGNPVNFAFNLLRVMPEVPFIAHEAVEELMDLAHAPGIGRRGIEVPKGVYKGLDSSDLQALVAFTFP